MVYLFVVYLFVVYQGHRWTDSSPTDYTNWNRGEPNDAGGIEDCVSMINTGKWNDINCFFSKPFVCKIQKGVPLSTTPVIPTASSCKLYVIELKYKTTYLL